MQNRISYSPLPQLPLHLLPPPPAYKQKNQCVVMSEFRGTSSAQIPGSDYQANQTEHFTKTVNAEQKFTVKITPGRSANFFPPLFPGYYCFKLPQGKFKDFSQSDSKDISQGGPCVTNNSNCTHKGVKFVLGKGMASKKSLLFI